MVSPLGSVSKSAASPRHPWLVANGGPQSHKLIYSRSRSGGQGPLANSRAHQVPRRCALPRTRFRPFNRGREPRRGGLDTPFQLPGVCAARASCDLAKAAKPQPGCIAALHAECFGGSEVAWGEAWSRSCLLSCVCAPTSTTLTRLGIPDPDAPEGRRPVNRARVWSMSPHSAGQQGMAPAVARRVQPLLGRRGLKPQLVPSYRSARHCAWRWCCVAVTGGRCRLLVPRRVGECGHGVARPLLELPGRGNR